MDQTGRKHWGGEASGAELQKHQAMPGWEEEHHGITWERLKK